MDFQLKSRKDRQVDLGLGFVNIPDLDLTEGPIHRYRGMRLSQPIVGDSHPMSGRSIEQVNII